MPFEVPDWLVKAVIQRESSGNPAAVSPAGAQGLMQVMPGTARDPGFGIKPLQNAFDAGENERFGRDYLGAMLGRYEGDTEAALIGYNAGPGNADKWIKADRDYAVLPKRGETEPYVRDILAMEGKEAKMNSAAGAFEPWQAAYDKTQEAKSPIGQLLMQEIGEKKKELAGGGGTDDWQKKLSTALYHGGLAMMKAGGEKGATFWGSLGQGLGGAATGLESLKAERKKTAEGGKDELFRLKTAAARLASPSVGRNAKSMRFDDLLKLVKDEGGGFIDPSALRKAAIKYGFHIKGDTFGSAYLQNTVKDLAAKAESGDISDEEKADLEALTELYSDVGQ
jgi:hypothetical protein